jgi:hypothetical protein
MTFSGGRWNAALDTSMLPGACYTVTASIDGLAAGSFRLDLGADVATTRATPKANSTVAPPRRGPKGR